MEPRGHKPMKAPSTRARSSRMGAAPGPPREHGPGHLDLGRLGPGTERTSLLLPGLACWTALQWPWQVGAPALGAGGAGWEPAVGSTEGRGSELLMAQLCVDVVRTLSHILGARPHPPNPGASPAGPCVSWSPRVPGAHVCKRRSPCLRPRRVQASVLFAQRLCAARRPPKA